MEKDYKREYYKRVKHWHANLVKVPKTYPYMRFLVCRIMTRRKQDMETVNRAFVKPKDDPKLISPTIDGVLLSTEDLVSEKLSRLSK